MPSAAGLAALGVAIYKNWEPLKKLFREIGEILISPITALKTLNGLLPENLRIGALGDRLKSAVGSVVAPSAVTPGAAAQVNGAVTVKVETAPGVRARVTDQRASGGIDLGVETGYAMAGA